MKLEIGSKQNKQKTLFIKHDTALKNNYTSASHCMKPRNKAALTCDVTCSNQMAQGQFIITLLCVVTCIWGRPDKGNFQKKGKVGKKTEKKALF